MNPKISIIMPVYNVEKFIERSILSALNQTFKDMEVLIVDDCGRDNSMEIANKLAKTDSRIRILRHEKNKGQGEARNTGLDEALGEYICFLDSDDYIEKNLLEVAHSVAQINQADIVVYGTQMVFDNNHKKQPFTSNTLNPICNFDALQFLSTYKIGYMPWDKLVKKTVIDMNHIRFLPILHEDIPFSIECVYYSTKTIVIPNLLYNYFQREDSTQNSKRIDEKYFKSYFEVIRYVSAFIDEKEVFNKSPNTAKLIEKGLLIWLLERLKVYYSNNDVSDRDLLLSVLYKHMGSNGYFVHAMFDMILEMLGITMKKENINAVVSDSESGLIEKFKRIVGRVFG